jgi:hypothetical protein
MTTQELDIHSDGFESALPPRLTLGRDVADAVAAYKQPFIEEWGIEDKAVGIIEGIGYICFDGFGDGEPNADGDFFSDTTLLGADSVALSDMVVETDDTFVVSMHLYQGEERLDLDAGKEGHQYDHDNEYVVFVAPDMPPTAVFTSFIDSGSGNHVSQLSDAVAKYGSEILHPLSDEDCTELVRLLSVARVNRHAFQSIFEDRVMNHWEEY